MATGPVDADPGESLHAEHDELARRCAESERTVARLIQELAEAQAQIAALRAQAASAQGGLSLFEGTEDHAGRITGDGSDPRILSMALGATALVGGMVTILALLNGTLITPFGLLILVLTIGLAADVGALVTQLTVGVV